MAQKCHVKKISFKGPLYWVALNPKYAIFFYKKE